MPTKGPAGHHQQQFACPTCSISLAPLRQQVLLLLLLLPLARAG